MPLLINQQPVTGDRWISVNDAETLEVQPADTDLIIAWPLYLEQAEQLDARSGQLGVAIPNDLDLDELIPVLPKLTLVALEFPSFADGRAFSQAQLLRRQGFKGQIRARGDVTWDRLRFMLRCGIDAMEIAEERFTPEMVRAFAEISVRNQGAADDSLPIYRQREA